MTGGNVLVSHDYDDDGDDDDDDDDDRDDEFVVNRGT